MAIQKNRGLIAILLSALLSVTMLMGCGESDSPSGPSTDLGEEIDLSLYLPSSYEGYDLKYQVTRGKGTIEARLFHCNNETLYETDPASGQQVTIQCQVLHQDSEYGSQPDTRVYLADRYVYALKTNEGGVWGALRYLQPKWPLRPAQNPRVGQTFDTETSNFIYRYTMFETQFRLVHSMRDRVTYIAVEDSVTVPAGTFYDVLKAKVSSRRHTKETLAADTTEVYTDYVSESANYVWDAPGIGTIKVVGADRGIDYEKVLLQATVDGVTYPVGK